MKINSNLLVTLTRTPRRHENGNFVTTVSELRLNEFPYQISVPFGVGFENFLAGTLLAGRTGKAGVRYKSSSGKKTLEVWL